MKAVSNTTPLRYLIAIEQQHLLGKLFEKVFVPIAVHSKAQICEQSLDFIAGQDIWRRAAFGALPNPLNGVAVAEVVTATVIEQQAHYIPYFAACSWRSVQRLQP